MHQILRRWVFSLVTYRIIIIWHVNLLKWSRNSHGNFLCAIHKSETDFLIEKCVDGRTMVSILSSKFDWVVIFLVSNRRLILVLSVRRKYYANRKIVNVNLGETFLLKCRFFDKWWIILIDFYDVTKSWWNHSVICDSTVAGFPHHSMFVARLKIRIWYIEEF